MELYRTVLSDNYLRLEEDGGASVTTYRADGRAHILSVTVPKSDRREGLGSALLSAMEQELLDQGIKSLDAEFCDIIPGMKELFEKAGYEITSAAPVFSVDTEQVLSSLTVKKALATEVDDASFSPLSALDVSQLDEILELLINHNVRLTNSDVARFHQQTSGVVYDTNSEPQSFILCSETEEGLNVELLVGQSGSPKHIIAALTGMVNGIKASGGADAYKKLTMIAANDSVNTLLEKVTKKSSKPEKIGDVVFAEKKLQKEELDDIEIEEELDEDLEDEWRREIRKAPFQANIGFKMRMFKDTDGKPAAPKASSAGKKGAVNRPKEAAFIHFDKEETETEGLLFGDTMRITVDNMSRFAGVLPQDVFTNLVRPFFHGLVIPGETDDKPQAIVVWEYHNMDADEEIYSEIVYFKADDEKLGEQILKEYTHEIEQEEPEVSAFWMEEISSTEQDILKNAEFSIQKIDSRDIVATIEEIARLSFVSKKWPGRAYSIGRLDEKQFKRGISDALFHGHGKLMEDLIFVGMGWYDTEVSSCCINDGRVTGLLLVHSLSKNRVMVDLLYSSGVEYRIDAVNMIRFSLKAAYDKFGKGTEVLIRRHNEKTDRLIDKMFGDRDFGKVLYGERGE